MNARSRAAEAKEVLAGYYRERGTMPSVQEFANRMGYSSTSSAHFVLEQLFEEGFVAKTETGRLMPGTQFAKAAARPAVPAELLAALPAGEGLEVVEVGPEWVIDDTIRPGDLLVLARPARTEDGEQFLLSRGDTYAVAPLRRSGWKTHGAVLGLYRPLGKGSSWRTRSS